MHDVKGLGRSYHLRAKMSEDNYMQYANIWYGYHWSKKNKNCLTYTSSLEAQSIQAFVNPWICSSMNRFMKDVYIIEQPMTDKLAINQSHIWSIESSITNCLKLRDLQVISQFQTYVIYEHALKYMWNWSSLPPFRAGLTWKKTSDIRQNPEKCRTRIL